MPIDLMEHPPVMAKPKGLPVRLDDDVVEMARIVATYRNETINEVISAIVRPVLQKMEQEEVAKRKRLTQPPRRGKDSQ